MGDWAQTNIVRVSIPVKRFLGRDGPLTFEFHRLAAEQLVEMWLEWEKEGLLDHIVTFDGSYVPRFMRGSRTKLSNHAFGTAFDINAQFNALGAEPARMRERGCVRELVPIANKYGFFWGGHFQGRSDGMHFEVARLL
jgi:D-alanyl-D-alanine carboxypeptidase